MIKLDIPQQDYHPLLKVRGEGTCAGFSNPLSLATEIAVPEGVVRVNSKAFADYHSVTSIKLPSTLKFIHSDAFSRTSIREIHIPTDIEFVRIYAFTACPNLTKLILDSEETARKIDRRAFSGTNLKEIEIDGVSYPVFSGSLDHSPKIYVKDGVIECIKDTEADFGKLQEKTQEWFEAFKQVPLENLLDRSNIPDPISLYTKETERWVSLRLGGKI